MNGFVQSSEQGQRRSVDDTGFAAREHCGQWGRKDAEPIQKRAQKAAALVGAMVDAGRCDAAREVIMQWYSEELPSFAMGNTPEQARRNLEDILDAGPLEQDKAVETWREIADDLLALTRS